MTTGHSGILPVQIGQIIHIGAGRGAELPSYLAQAAQGITLVEPDPEALSVLYEVAQGEERVRIVGTAVASHGGSGTLHRFDFSDLNSLHKPTGLWHLFPGLQEMSCETVAVSDPVTLVDQMMLDDNAEHLLVIEAPGAALDILTALQEAGRLTRFSWVRVQEGRTSLYENAGDIEQIRALLDAVGFTGNLLAEDMDPDRPVLAVRFDEARMLREELAALRAQITATEAERDTAVTELAQSRTALTASEAALATREASLAELRAELSAERTRRVDAVAEHEAAMESAQATLAELRAELSAERTRRADAAAEHEAAMATREASLAELRAELSAETARRADAAAEHEAAMESAQASLAELRAELSAERTRRADAAAEHEAALATRETTLAELREELSAERTRRVDAVAEHEAAMESAQASLAAKAQDAKQLAAREAQLDQQVANMQAEKASQDSRLADLEKRLEQGDKAAETLRSSLAKAKNDLKKEADSARIAVRMQALAHADLSELQRRHAELRIEKDNQDSLLLKVTQRLGDAAEYLKNLGASGEESQLARSVDEEKQARVVTEGAPASGRSPSGKGKKKAASKTKARSRLSS